MSNQLPDKGWKHYGRPGHPYSPAAKELREAAIQADAFGHANRELAFSQWLYRNTGIEWDIKGRLDDIADRKEFQP